MSHAAQKSPKRRRPQSARTKKGSYASRLPKLGKVRFLTLAVATYLLLCIFYMAALLILPLPPPATALLPEHAQALPFGIFRVDVMHNGGVALDMAGGHLAQALSPYYPLWLSILRALQCTPFLYLGWTLGGNPTQREAIASIRWGATFMLIAWGISIGAALIEYNYITRTIRYEGIHMRVHILVYIFGPVLCVLLRRLATLWEGYIVRAREEQGAVARELGTARATSLPEMPEQTEEISTP